MTETVISLGLAEACRPLLGLELRALILHSHSADTADVGRRLGAGETTVAFGGSVELRQDREGGRHLSWHSMQDGDYGLGLSANPWQTDHPLDQLAATLYWPWEGLVGLKMTAIRTYGFPESKASYVSAAEQAFVGEVSALSVWTWTTSLGGEFDGTLVLPGDDITLTLNTAPANLAELELMETVH